MKLYLVTTNGSVFGIYPADDEAAAERAAALDVNDPAVHVKARPYDLDRIVLDRVEAVEVGFDLDGTGAIPAAAAMVALEINDGAPTIGFSVDGDADRFNGLNWTWLDLPRRQLIDDALAVMAFKKLC